MVKYQPNAQLVINNLTQKLANTNVENAMLQAVVDELSAENEKLKKEKENKDEQQPAK